MKAKKGFTLIELLVVIAIIALLMSILMPALGIAKELAGAAVCAAREKQILLAWTVYSQANDGNLCTPNTYDYDPSDDDFDWVAFDDVSYSRLDCTAEQEIEGVLDGVLYDYYEDPKLVHCPTDKRYSSAPANSAYGGNGGYRTYSFVHHANGNFKQGLIDSGRMLSESEIFKKLDELRTPSSKFVLVEENDNRGLNLGTWVMKLTDDPGFVDPFAVFHNMRSVLGFGDGHIERIAWKDNRTEKFSDDISNGTNAGYGFEAWANLPQNDYNSDNEDLVWLQDHYGRNK